jgi:hypothetical protein
MELRWQDFDGADAAADGDYQAHWADLEAVLRSLPVHFKASDHPGIQGSVIFDPVGTNDFIKTSLVARRSSAKSLFFHALSTGSSYC